MTDEVFSDNLDEASKADTEAAAAVEALPAEGEAVQAVAADQATDEQAQSEQDAPEEQTAETTEDEDTEQDAGAKAVEEFSKSLRTLEGKWYVLHTYSGYEKRVKTNVESRVASFGMEDKIFQVEVPMEEVEKHTEKGKKVITRVRVPGYVLDPACCRMRTPVVSSARPKASPALSARPRIGTADPQGSRLHDGSDESASEALKAAGDKPAAAKKRKLEVSYAPGDQVTVTDGPFTTMAAVVSEAGPVHAEAHRARVHLRP